MRRIATSACISPRTFRRNGLAATAALLAAALVGCAQTRGPELIVNSHADYNRAVSQVLKQELLLNVVRRRYMEAPQFVDVASISTSFKTSSSVAGEVGIVDWSADNQRDFSLDGSLTFTDTPTITLTPRQGEDIATQLHEPLSVTTVADLLSAGYGIHGAFDILVEGINNLRGADLRHDGFRSASGEWNEAVDLLESLYDEGSLVIDRFRWNDPYNDQPYPAEAITAGMWITTLSTGAYRWKSYDGGQTYYYTSNEMGPAMWLEPGARRSEDGGRLIELLNVQPDVLKRIWYMEPARVGAGADLEGRPDDPRPTLKLRMRSLYNVLNFFSYGVSVPLEDEREGRATDLSSFREAVARGEVRDYSKRFSVRHSEEPPVAAFEAIRYRGLWFYIDDRDLTSKAGFNALYDLWQLSIRSDSTQSEPLNVIQVN